MADEQTQQQEESTETTEITETTEKSTETTAETIAKEKEDVEEEDELQLSDSEKVFVKQLMNPNTSAQTLQMIAAGMGLELVKPGNVDRTRKDPTIDEELSAELGDDYGFLGPKIGKVIAKRMKAIEDKVDTKLNEQSINAQTNALKRAEKRFFDDNPEARKLRKRMVSLAGDYPIPKGKDANDYVRDLYKVAGGTDDVSIATVNQRRGRRADQNRSQATDDNRNREGAPEFTVRKVKGRVSLRDAVTAASKGEQLERED